VRCENYRKGVKGLLNSCILMDSLTIMYRNKFLVPAIYIVLSVGVISIVVFAVKREKDRVVL